jgi:low affinity Fe/Cu permease
LTEAKIIAGLVGIIVFLGAIFFGFRTVYDAGHTAGVLLVQNEWDADKAAIQKVTDAAIASATKQRDDALAANEAIESDYQNKLSTVAASATVFAARLRNAEATIAANRNSVPKTPNNSSSTPAGTASSADQLGQLVTLVTGLRTECAANSDQLDALIAQIKTQL